MALPYPSGRMFRLADQWRSSRPASAEAGADVAADAAPAPAAEAEAAVATEAAGFGAAASNVDMALRS